MIIKIKDKEFILKDNLSVIDINYLKQKLKCSVVNNNFLIAEPRLSNFKLLISYVEDKDGLINYCKQLIKKKQQALIDRFSNYKYLYDFQKDGINKILNSRNGGFILSFEQGLGKTLTSLVTAELRNETNVWIIVPASLLLQWKNEINNWFNDSDVCIYKGTKQKRAKLYKDNHKYNVISYETLSNDYSDLNLKQNLNNCFAIFDESTKLKNKKTKLYKTFKLVCQKVGFKLFLTGTPVNNKLQDIDNVIRLISNNIVDNVNNYIIWEQVTVGWGANARVFMKQVGYKNLNKYNELINPIYYRKSKDEVASQLPKKNIIRIDIEQTPLHKKIREAIINELSSFSGFTLLQLLDCGLEVFQKSKSENAELFSDMITSKISNPKLDVLKDLIEEINNQVIIYSRFKDSCNMIGLQLQKQFPNLKIAIVNSDTNNKDEIANKFRNKEIDIVITTYTWAKGISFTDIDYLINYDIPTSYEMYFQIQDRIHRINSTTPKFIYNLVGNVIENHIMDLLEDKVKLAKAVTEGKGDEVLYSDMKEEINKLLGWKK